MNKFWNYVLCRLPPCINAIGAQKFANRRRKLPSMISYFIQILKDTSVISVALKRFPLVRWSCIWLKFIQWLKKFVPYVKYVLLIHLRFVRICIKKFWVFWNNFTCVTLVCLYCRLFFGAFFAGNLFITSYFCLFQCVFIVFIKCVFRCIACIRNITTYWNDNSFIY